MSKALKGRAGRDTLHAMLVPKAVLFLHIASAILLLSGVIGGAIVGEFARRAQNLEQRRSLVALGSPFERMTTIAVPLTILSGLVTLMLFGYAITALWVLATGVVILVLVALQILFWNRVGPQVHEALGRGDDVAAMKLLSDPRRVAVVRIEVGLSFLTVALMVFRPTL